MNKYIFILFVLATGCKSHKVAKPILLDDFVKKEKSRSIVGDNPLFVRNGEPIGRQSDLNFPTELLNIKYHSLSSTFKNNKWVINLFGEAAQDGVISFEDRVLFYCKRPPPEVFVLNEEEVDFEKFYAAISAKQISHYSRIEWVKRSQDSTYLYSRINFAVSK